MPGARPVRSLVDAKLVRGAYWVEEISILQFLPLRVMPHLHAIIDGEWSSAAQEHLTASLTAFENPNRDPLVLVPSIQALEITSQRQLFNRIQYMFKPINIVAPYRNAWPVASAQERELAMRLNGELRNFVDGYSTITFERDKIYSKGTLTARSPRFIGVRAALRDTQRDLVQEVARSPEEFYQGGVAESQ